MKESNSTNWCKFLSKMSMPINTTCLYFLLLCLLSNICNLYQSFSWTDLIKIMGMTAIEAYVITWVIQAFERLRLRKFVLYLVAFLLNAVLVAEYFCYANFSRILGQPAIDIIAQTNVTESKQFLQTYLNGWVIGIIVVGVVVVNTMIVYIARQGIRFKTTRMTIGALIVIGIATLIKSIVTFVCYRNGEQMPQYTSITRIGYSCYIVHKNIRQIDASASVFQTIDVEKGTDRSAIVFVIGESFNKRHSSAYGYEKPTNPNMERRIASGNMLRFEDVVTTDNFTGKVMTSIFMLQENEMDSPLFPMFFRKAGYRVTMLDNQYFVGDGVSILSSKKLSDVMFDRRNTVHYGPEERIVKDIVSDSLSLTIVHLWGMHYTYADRYPHDRFSVFKPEDYDLSISLNHREIIAHYDNATLYNDYIIEEIIRKLEDKDAILIYLPDHGEEVYDYRNYIGHGSASGAQFIKYQIEIPMFVWMSDSYRQRHAGTAEALRGAVSKPIISSNMGCFFLDLAGLKSSYCDPSRSFINEAYDASRPRIVLHSVDYDRVSE